MRAECFRVLGIESSCDETAAAVVEFPLRVRSSVVASQIAVHQPYGGVVPELAAREHVPALPGVLAEAVERAGVDWSELDAIAATQGPGLSSALLSGLTAGWGLSRRLGVAFYPVNHLEGHVLSLFLDAPPDTEICPSLVLLVTGGHTALLRMNAPGEYECLGRSIDDAAGEALDKGARLLDLPYPGGPEIEKLARTVDREPQLTFPRGAPSGSEALRRGGKYAFSFSGLKTSLRTRLDADPDAESAEVAAAYQEAVMDTLVIRVRQALQQEHGFKSVACVGGVANNRLLRGKLEDCARDFDQPLLTVPSRYCTDNAAMIAAVPLLRALSPLEQPPSADPNLPLSGLALRG